MIDTIHQKIQEFKLRFHLWPDTLIISNSAWDTVRHELGNLRHHIEHKPDGTIFMNMKVITTGDIQDCEVAFAARSY